MKNLGNKKRLHTCIIFPRTWQAPLGQVKGQITIFIILGILLLLLIGLIFYFQKIRIKEAEEVTAPIIASVPYQLRPVASLVEGCIVQTAKEGLVRLGQQGGYIEPKYGSNQFEPTEGESATFTDAPEPPFIPYWWFLKSDNECIGKCEFTTLKPNLYQREGEPSLERQLKRFVEENLKECVGNFEKLAGFEVNEQRKPEVDLRIGKDKIYIVLNYPLSVRIGSATSTVNEFAGEIDLNLKEIYELAQEIFELQKTHSFLERHTRQLIDGFSRRDQKFLPPVSDLTYGFKKPVFWTKFSVEKNLQQVLASYVPLLQVPGTKNYKYIQAPIGFGDDELYEVLYNRGMIVVQNKSYPTLETSFAYLPQWRPYFDLNCDGQACTPESVTAFFQIPLGIQRYNFVYDVSYPVLVSIRNPEAFNEQGYTFQYLLEANLRDNEPMPAVFEPLQSIQLGAGTTYCDEEKGTSPTTISIIDGKTKQPLQEAQVLFTCGDVACDLGTTTQEVIKTKLPKCINGVLQAEKFGYASGAVSLDVLDLGEQQHTLVLEPYREADFKAKKYLLLKGINGWHIDRAREPVLHEANEITLVTLARKTRPLEQKFSGMGEIRGAAVKGKKDIDLSKNVRLLPGNYTVNIYTYKELKEEIKIPTEERCFATGIGRECKGFPPEDVVLNPLGKSKTSQLYIGGAKFDWELKPSTLDKAKAIEFRYVHFGLDKLPEANRKIEDLQELGKINEYSEEYRDLMEPVIVT